MKVFILVKLIVAAIVVFNVSAKPNQVSVEANVPEMVETFPVCQKAADLLFVVDTSNSIYRPHFNHNMKDFILGVIRHFNVGPGPKDARMGLVQFSSRVYWEFYLKSYKTMKDIKFHIRRRMLHRGGGTNTHLALNYVAKRMLTTQHGMRGPEVPKLVIVITDGSSHFPDRTKQAAQDLKAMQGVEVFAIGIGNRIRLSELQDMASQPYSDYVFHVSSFATIQKIQSKLITQACQACSGKAADIYFLLDASSSVGISHFHTRVLPFVRNLVSSFDISPMKTRIGLATYSNEVNHVFGLAKHRNHSTLLQAIQPENVAYLKGGTNTAEAISFVTKKGMSHGQTRKGVAHIIITITDGQSNDPEKTAQAAQVAQQQGIYMYAVGVGKSVDQTELSAIASDPDQDFVLTIDSFDGLASITSLLALRTCDTMPKPNDDSDATFDNKFGCPLVAMNVMFIYDYMSSVHNSKLILSHLISSFVDHAALVAPYVKIGIMTQPCVGGQIPMMGLADFRESLALRSSRYHVTLADMIRTVRTENFNKHHLVKQGRVVVLVLNAETMTQQHSQSLREEAGKMKFQGIRVIVVVVGDKGRLPQSLIETVASSPASDYILGVSSYQELQTSDLRLMDKICSLPKSSFQSSYLPHNVIQGPRLPQNVTRGRHLPQNATQGPLLPQNVTRGRHLPQNVTQGPLLPQNVTQGRHLPQNVTHGPLLPQNVTQRPLLPHNVTRGRHLPQNVTQGPLLPQNVTHGLQLPQFPFQFNGRPQ